MNSIKHSKNKKYKFRDRFLILLPLNRFSNLNKYKPIFICFFSILTLQTQFILIAPYVSTHIGCVQFKQNFKKNKQQFLLMKMNKQRGLQLSRRSIDI